jgi:hypothetical protein
MKYTVFAAFFVMMAIVGGYNAAPKFDFASATPEARHQWVSDVVKPFSRGLDRGLPKGNGLEPHMSVQSTSVSPDGMSVDIQISLKGPAQMRVDAATARAGIRQATCANYMGSLLGQSGVKLKTRFVHPDKGEMFSATLSQSECAKYIN